MTTPKSAPTSDPGVTRTAQQYEMERAETIHVLRSFCAAHGDNEWADTLHLADVIEKHLRRHIEESVLPSDPGVTPLDRIDDVLSHVIGEMSSENHRFAGTIGDEEAEVVNSVTVDEWRGELERLRQALAVHPSSLEQKGIDAMNELHALQLAACDVAALSNTRESYDKAHVERDNPAWTCTYQSVRNAVLREIEHREKLDALAVHQQTQEKE